MNQFAISLFNRWIRPVFGLCLMCMLLTAAPAQAQDISIEATVNVNRIPLGSAVNLTITIKGTQNVSAFDLPPIPDFDTKFIGPSRNISVVNNQYTTSISFTYSMLPLKAGKLQIPMLQVTIDGNTYSTDAIMLDVYDPAVEGDGPQAETELREKIFVQLQVPSEEVYINEPMQVKVFLYTSGVAIRDIQYPKMDMTGFIDEAYEQPRQYQQVIEGKRFEIVEFEKSVYPTRTGELSIGPAQVDCNIVMRNNRRRGSSLMEDDFFSAFFDRGEKRPAKLLSDPVKLTVKPLPKEGQPASFTGGVGNLDFSADISPAEVNVGDPITLRMKIQGKGNLNAVAFPELKNSDQFKLYDPIIKEEGRVKTLEQVLIPKSTDVTEIPAFDFSYFNISLNKYVESREGPFPIKVSPAEQDGGLTMVGGLGQSSIIVPPEQLGEDIVFIKDSPGKFHRLGQRMYNSVSFYVVLILVMAALIGGYIWYRLTHRLETDSAFARKLKASKLAKRGLKHTQQLMEQGKEQEFYDETFKLLKRYLSDKLVIPAGTVNIHQVREKVKDLSFDEMILSAVKTTFDECESIRYASARISNGQMQATQSRVQKVIEYFERKVR